MDQLLTLQAAAQLHHVDAATFRLWIRKGIIPYVMVGPARVKRVPTPVEEPRRGAPQPAAR